MKTRQHAAESRYGIGIVLVKSNQQAVRVGSAQSEDEAIVRVNEIVSDLRAGKEIGEPHDGAVVVLNPQRTYSVFAWSIDQATGAPDKTIVETRIRPNGRAKQEKRAA